MKTVVQYAVVLLVTVFLPGCKFVVNSLAFYPDNINVIPSEKLPDGIKELTIESVDGVKTTSLYLPSAGSEKLLIYFHGNAGNIYSRIPGLLHLHAAGINVIGVSYRGYGKSEGWASENGVYRDGEAIFQHAVERMRFGKEDIFILGRSIGSTVAINTAQHKGVGGVILVSPLTSGRSLAKASGMGWFSFLAGKSFNNIEKIGDITSPVLVIHGTDDRVVPYPMGEAIFERAQTNKRFVTIEGAGHNNLQGDYATEYWPPIIEFINRI